MVAKWMNTNNEYVDEHIIIPIFIYVVDTILTVISKDMENH